MRTIFDEVSYFEPPEGEEWVINRGGVGKGVLTANGLKGFMPETKATNVIFYCWQLFNN